MENGRSITRIISCLLAMTLCLGALPVVYATEIEDRQSLEGCSTEQPSDCASSSKVDAEEDEQILEVFDKITVNLRGQLKIADCKELAMVLSELPGYIINGFNIYGGKLTVLASEKESSMTSNNAITVSVSDTDGLAYQLGAFIFSHILAQNDKRIVAKSADSSKSALELFSELTVQYLTQADGFDDRSEAGEVVHRYFSDYDGLSVEVYGNKTQYFRMVIECVASLPVHIVEQSIADKLRIKVTDEALNMYGYSDTTAGQYWFDQDISDEIHIEVFPYQRYGLLRGNYSSLNCLYHEFGHYIYDWVLTTDEMWKVQREFSDGAAKKLANTVHNNYCLIDDREYFAELFSFYYTDHVAVENSCNEKVTAIIERALAQPEHEET